RLDTRLDLFKGPCPVFGHPSAHGSAPGGTFIPRIQGRCSRDDMSKPQRSAKLGPKLLKGMKEELRKGAVMKAKATQSFAQGRGTRATPAGVAKAGATQGTFTTSDAIPWKPVDPKHPGLMMFVVWGNPNEGASLNLQRFPAGMDSGWHTHTAPYQGVVIQGKFTHTFEGA